ncbi:MAG: saccharopine dehydrogenase C-terminal domain-containing protein, partial [Chitinophagaceae bacterium]
HRRESSFRLDGFDSSYTAMATTVGLPLAHAAELILQGEIRLTGVQIPTSMEIYKKVLPKLETDGIVFLEENY